jgi:hypothetical protein
MELENMFKDTDKPVKRRDLLKAIGYISIALTYARKSYAQDKEANPISVDYWTKQCFSSSTLAGSVDTCYYMTSENKEYITIVGGAGVNLSGDIGIFGLGFKNQVGFTMKIPKGTSKKDIEKAVKYEMEKIGGKSNDIWTKLKEKNGELFDRRFFRKPQRVMYIPYNKSGSPDFDYIGSEEWNKQMEKVLKTIKK